MHSGGNYNIKLILRYVWSEKKRKRVLFCQNSAQISHTMASAPCLFFWPGCHTALSPNIKKALSLGQPVEGVLLNGNRFPPTLVAKVNQWGNGLCWKINNFRVFGTSLIYLCTFLRLHQCSANPDELIDRLLFVYNFAPNFVIKQGTLGFTLMIW